MKALLQRVSQASVSVEGVEISSIGQGLLIFLGVCQGDTEEDVHKLVQKISQLRVMQDEDMKMNLSIQDMKGEILLVSQFTLCSRTKKGNRPSFVDADNPEIANKYYQLMKTELTKFVPVKTGKFGAYMDISLHNDGPVSIMLDTKE